MSRAEHLDRWGRDISVVRVDGGGRPSTVKNFTANNLQTMCLSCHGERDYLRRTAEWDWRKVTPERIAKGSRNGSAKLTEKQVADMRRRYGDRKTPTRIVAEEFQVSSSLVSLILSGRAWKHVSWGEEE